MAEGGRQYRKHLRSVRGAGARPQYVTVLDEQAQATFVVDRVLEARERGIDLRRQAVLFRNADHSDVLELELMRRNVPFVKYGGLKFLEAAHVKDLLAGAALGRQPAQPHRGVSRAAVTARDGPCERAARLRCVRGRLVRMVCAGGPRGPPRHA